MTAPAPSLKAMRLRVRGIVQGVGFRPTVWRLARQLGLVGRVRNEGDGVVVEAAGPEAALQALAERIRLEAPPLARIDALEREPMSGLEAADFRIEESAGGGGPRPVVPPDAAICEDCARELRDPFDRRYRYPFLNCTRCGPRFSILEGIPYDRARTTMRAFPMCADCRREYEAPADRRFHAQPTACHACGPRAWLERAGGGTVAFDAYSQLDAVDAVAGLLRRGFIVAIKGLGGFHLACLATDAAAVRRLRARKRRDRKPFALMARDPEVIRRYAHLCAAEEALLRGPRAPILLLQATGPERLPAEVAPGLDLLGFMLPYTPLHLLVMRRLEVPVVMTSGNLSDEPQVIDEEEARTRLGDIADVFLMHDRPIANRVDDSVVRVIDGAPRPLRRARGWVPEAVPLSPRLAASPPLFAVGGDLKNCFGLLVDGAAVLSQHLGDLADARVEAAWRRARELFFDLFCFRPKAVVIDRHPAYRGRVLGEELALELGVPVMEVQHHAAHFAAVLAEHGFGPGEAAVGLVLDGTGWGEDGTVWGLEAFVGDLAAPRRIASLRSVPMPGGERAAREPFLMLLAHLSGLGEEVWAKLPERLGDRLAGELRRFAPVLAGRLPAVRTSSAGRLFDAVAALLGFPHERQAYEGEAAMWLEALAARAAGADEKVGPELVPVAVDGGGIRRLDPAPLLHELIRGLAAGVAPARLAYRFHRALAAALVELASGLAAANGLATVALSGGCFHNRLLTEAVASGLRNRGLEVLVHRAVPAGDGGLALGQLAAVAARLSKEV